MKRQTFEEFLEEVHAENYTGTDDDMPDAFANWVSELDLETVLELAEDFGASQFLAGQTIGNPDAL